MQQVKREASKCNSLGIDTPKYTTPKNTHLDIYLDLLFHICTIFFTIFMIYIGWKEHFESIFAWHAIFMTIGLMLMCNAILVYSKENLIMLLFNFDIRLNLHWIFNTISVVILTIGYLIAYVYTLFNTTTHNNTAHGFIGFISIIIVYISIPFGITARYSESIKRYFKPACAELSHSAIGLTALFLGFLSVIISYEEAWFAARTSHYALSTVMCIVANIYQVFYVFFRVFTYVVYYLKIYNTDND